MPIRHVSSTGDITPLILISRTVGSGYGIIIVIFYRRGRRLPAMPPNTEEGAGLSLMACLPCIGPERKWD